GAGAHDADGGTHRAVQLHHRRGGAGVAARVPPELPVLDGHRGRDGGDRRRGDRARRPAGHPCAARRARERARSTPPPHGRRGGPRTWRIDAVPTSGRLTASSERLVQQIRALPAPFYVGVAGQTAGFIDQKASLGHHLPLALGILALTTFAILFVFTGSVVLP